MSSRAMKSRVHGQEFDPAFYSRRVTLCFLQKYLERGTAGKDVRNAIKNEYFHNTNSRYKLVWSKTKENWYTFGVFVICNIYYAGYYDQAEYKKSMYLSTFIFMTS